MYKIIGDDKKVYGPVSIDQLRQWQAEGRVNGETQVQAEGSAEWIPLASIPGFGVPPPVSMPPPSGVRQRGNGAAVAGLVFGVLANVFYSAHVFPILGIVFSAIALGRQGNRKCMAVAGMVLSIIGMTWFGIFPFFWLHHRGRHW